MQKSLNRIISASCTSTLYSNDTRLQLVHVGRTTNILIPFTPIFCVNDEKGNQVLNGKLYMLALLGNPENAMALGMTPPVQHGPANTTSHELDTDLEHDIVLCLHCDSWPSLSEEWIYRPRLYNWPSTDLIKKVIGEGCELVAIGNPLSTE